MKQTILILTFIVLFINPIFSQERTVNSNTLNFKVMPLSLLAYNPRHRIGLEYISDNRVGYSIDFGLGHKSINQGRLNGLIWGKDYSYYEIKPEIKYLFINKKNNFIYAAM
jgi:hypothetical protein